MQPINDPAPSRASYRLQRLWLTPTFRFLVRKVLPVCASIAVILLVFTSQTVVNTVQNSYASLRDTIESRPEFAVTQTRISGASATTQASITQAMALSLPQSSFDLDMAALTDAIKKLDAVETATLVIKERGVMDVHVVERDAAVIWRGPNGLQLLDAQGQKVAKLAARTSRQDLPLIAGRGVPKAVGEALALMGDASDIAGRIRGLVRVGERRWDMVLDRGQRILLPETGARAALRRVLTLQRTNDMLARDITVVDMRNPNRVTVRLTQGAVQDFRSLLLVAHEEEI